MVESFDSMLTLALIFILPVALSFVCSLFESVLLSTTDAYLTVKAREGRPSAKLLLRFKTHISRPLSAILTFNTVANTLGAAAVAAEVQKLYGIQYVSAASGLLTFVILIFAEVIPKTLGTVYWKTLAPACAYGIQVLVFLGYPLVLLSEKVSKFIAGRRRTNGAGVSREEMIATAELSGTEGTLKAKEITVIKNLLRLDHIRVADIMTPRSVMSAIDASFTVGQIMERHHPLRFSRMPVFERDLDHVIGVVHRYRILDAASKDQHDLSVRQMTVPLSAVPESTSVASALDQFIKRREHIFLVVDEYGTTAGIVTLEDAIETLLGVEIIDEYDSVADLRQFAIDQWQKRKSHQVGATL